MDKIDQKIAELKAHQEAKLVIDIDEAFKEYLEKDEALEIKFEGKSFYINSKAPSDFVIFSAKNARNMDELSMIKLIQIAIGEEFVQLAEKSKIPFEMVIKQALGAVMDHYGLGVLSNDKSGNMKTPGS